jgi:hypothetical protein
LFGIIDVLIKGNLVSSQSIDLVQIGIDGNNMLIIVWLCSFPLKGNLLNSLSIAFVQIGIYGDWH